MFFLTVLRSIFFWPRFQVLDATDGDGRTALILAALSDHFDIIQTLVQGGVNLDLQVISTGQTALMISATKGNAEAVKAMLNAGANTTLSDHDGSTAPHFFLR